MESKRTLVLFCCFLTLFFCSNIVLCQAPPADPLLENLEGPDSEKGALAARDLLARIADGKTPRADYLAYLKRALDPSLIARGGPPVAVAERLVAALGYTAASGQPYPQEGVDLVLRLIGVGAEGLRKVVYDAVTSFARAERSGESPKVVAALTAMLQAEPSPAPATLSEISSILWRIDGKALLGSLIAVLSRNRANPRSDPAPYLLELREHLDLKFSTIEEWERWWAENQEQPIGVILQSVHRQFRSRHSELWRKTFRRIESGADPEAYLGAIADALELDPTPELRVAAVEALGGFHDWLRDRKFPADPSGAPSVDEPRRAALTSRALKLLVNLLGDAEKSGLGHPEMKRQALVAMRGYAGHLARSPGDEAAVSAALLSAFKAVPRAGARADLLELVRTAGALRVSACRPYLERILRDEMPFGRADLELKVESVGALGRVLERGVSREPVELIMKLYRTHRSLLGPEPAEKGHRDIMKACAAALNLRIEDPPLRDDVRRFLSGLLSNPEDKTARVPAIIGLGILAKGGDQEAVSALAGVLERRAEFEPAEATSAVDAIAYLGGREALEPLLPFLDARTDPFKEHVWRKVVSLLKGSGVVLLRWTLSDLEVRALQRDQPGLAALALQLSEEPEVAPLLASDRANAADPQEFTAFWESILLRVRAMELTGQDSRAAAALAMLKDLIIKNGRLKAIRPQAEEELTRAQASLTRRGAARAALVRNPPALPDVMARALLDVVPPGEDIETRWRGLNWVMVQLQGLKPAAESGRVAGEVLTVLADGRSEPLWRDLEPAVRARYLKSLESLRDRLKGSGTGTGN